jgi:hypothetical protein
VLPDPQAIELRSDVLLGTQFVRQVSHPHLVGVGEEGTGHLPGIREAIGHPLGQDMPHDHQQLADDCHDGLRPTQAGLQMLANSLPVGIGTDGPIEQPSTLASGGTTYVAETQYSAWGALDLRKLGTGGN